jgi:hypothetical protein
MTGATYVLGAAPLKLLRAKLGRLGYWIGGSAISLAFFAFHLPAMGIAYFSLVLLMGVFSELEEVGLSFPVCGFFTLLINSLLGGAAFAIWVSLTGPAWSERILAFVEMVLKPLTEMNPQMQVSYYDLMLQLPSAVIILWTGAIYLAVLLENRLNGGEPATAHSAAIRAQVSEFRLPDPAVWVFIASLLGAFGGFAPHAVEAVALNGLNVCLLLFFLQGIAVVAKAFATWRVGLFWQFLFMVLIVVHLFLIVSLLGLVDFWMDFRSRLAKSSEEFNREV